jgi:hypothetical protein
MTEAQFYLPNTFSMQESASLVIHVRPEAVSAQSNKNGPAGLCAPLRAQP